MFRYHLTAILALSLASPAMAQTLRDQNSTEPSFGQPTDGGATPSQGQSSGQAQSSTQAQKPANGLAWRNDRLTLTLADGDFTISPLLRFDLDGVSFFDQHSPNGFDSGTQVRRGRVGVRGTFLRDFEYNVTWEFGSYPSRTNTLFEAQVAWNGLGWGTVRAGTFTIQHLPEYAASSYDLLFLERASITNIVASLASGDTREAVGLEARGDRWNTSVYGTAGVTSTLHDNKQRGLVGRAVALLVDNPVAQFQLGFDGAAQFDPGTSPGADSIRLRDYPELRGDNANRFLDTGGIRAKDAYAYGPEAAGKIGPVYLEALYQHVVVDVPGAGSRDFDGWYVQTAVPLVGPPRQRVRNTGTWSRPRTQGLIDPLNGNWGALEAVGRYSTVSLRDGVVRGGEQSIWTGGLNWYLSPNLKVQAEYENGKINLDTRNRDFQAFGIRLAFSM
ncbi:OprO/OprP family phosphate-selective porin [Roseomonas elaeocarpi]|uniref:OprO/OprP family phosphate-selective porin n=1 Tax=Roseomonas elaeocarpi TaxID=907779 RepID=A0ABV6JLV9_9PROT